MTEIQFASAELVDVAIQCLNEITEEADCASVSAATPSVTAADTSHEDKESMNDKSASSESEKESKTKAEGSAFTKGSN